MGAYAGPSAAPGPLTGVEVSAHADLRFNCTVYTHMEPSALNDRQNCAGAPVLSSSPPTVGNAHRRDTSETAGEHAPYPCGDNLHEQTPRTTPELDTAAAVPIHSGTCSNEVKITPELSTAPSQHDGLSGNARVSTKITPQLARDRAATTPSGSDAPTLSQPELRTSSTERAVPRHKKRSNSSGHTPELARLSKGRESSDMGGWSDEPLTGELELEAVYEEGPPHVQPMSFRGQLAGWSEAQMSGELSLEPVHEEGQLCGQTLSFHGHWPMQPIACRGGAATEDYEPSVSADSGVVVQQPPPQEECSDNDDFASRKDTEPLTSAPAAVPLAESYTMHKDTELLDKPLPVADMPCHGSEALGELSSLDRGDDGHCGTAHFDVHEDTELLRPIDAIKAHGVGAKDGSFESESVDQNVSACIDGSPGVVQKRAALHSMHPALWMQQQAFDDFAVHEDTELLCTDAIPSAQRCKVHTDRELMGKHPALVPRTERFEVHEDTELLGKHPALAPLTERFEVHEDTELMGKHPALVPRTERFEVHEDTELLSKHPALAPRTERFEVHEDTELMGKHPALVPRTERFEVHEDTELLSKHPALVPRTERFEVHEDTELLSKHLALAPRTERFEVHEDTKLLGKHPALAPRTERFQVHEDTELLSKHVALATCTEQFEVHDDTEVLNKHLPVTQRPGTFGVYETAELHNTHPALAPRREDSEGFAVHEDTELLGAHVNMCHCQNSEELVVYDGAERLPESHPVLRAASCKAQKDTAVLNEDGTQIFDVHQSTEILCMQALQHLDEAKSGTNASVPSKTASVFEDKPDTDAMSAVKQLGPTSGKLGNVALAASKLGVERTVTAFPVAAAEFASAAQCGGPRRRLVFEKNNVASADLASADPTSSQQPHPPCTVQAPGSSPLKSMSRGVAPRSRSASARCASQASERAANLLSSHYEGEDLDHEHEAFHVLQQTPKHKECTATPVCSPGIDDDLENHAVPTAREGPLVSGRGDILATLHDAPDEVISEDEIDGDGSDGKHPMPKSKSAPATPIQTPLRWAGPSTASPAFSSSKPPLSPARPGLLVRLLLTHCYASCGLTYYYQDHCQWPSFRGPVDAKYCYSICPTAPKSVGTRTIFKGT
jgi:hypothetical protein